MKNIYKPALFACLFLSSLCSFAQPVIAPQIYPQYCSDTATGGRLPYVFRARITGLTANVVYRYYTRGMNAAIDGANGAAGASIFIKQAGNFTYTANPGFGGPAGFDTLRADLTGAITYWFAFEPARSATVRFAEGTYVHARVFIQPVTGGLPTVLTITDSIKCLKMDVNASNATGVYSTSLAAAKDIVFLYDNSAGNGRPLTGTWIETDGLNFKSGTGLGGTPNATSYPGFYRNNVDTITSAWGSFIPNNLSGGLLRAERRKLSDGAVAWANTDGDGIWDVGSVSTINASGGLNALSISTDDAPLISVPPKIFFTKATQSVAENAGTATVGVGLKFPGTSASSVDVTVNGGNAASGSDYTYTTQTVTFPANSTATQNVTITLSNDGAAENLETVILGLSNFTNAATAGAPATDTLTIIDDDAPFVEFASTASSGMESVTSVSIPVNIQFPTGTATSVNIAVTGGSATIGTDYTFSNQTLTFPASSATPINVSLTIINDAVTESDETIVFTLSSATNGAILGTSTFTYTIKNDDITPTLTFVRPTQIQVNEGAVTATVRVQLTNPALSATSITVSAFGGNATDAVDYMLSFNTLTFPANTASVINYTFPITDDNLIEGLETIILRLTNPTNPVYYTFEYDTVNIIDNDVPLYTVSQINKNDGNGVADSMGVRCELRGTVYGPNVRPTGYQFLMHDRTGGIQVLRLTGNFGGYMPQDKDSVVVKGQIAQANGQLQITNLDTVYKVGTGSYITPTVITSYSEANEGNYVTMKYCHLLNTTQWPTGAGTATVTIVDQNNKNYQTQVYRQTDIDSTQPTPYWFHITGMLVQNDINIPWDSLYFLVPLSLSNYEYVYPEMSFVTGSDTVQENIGLDSIELNLAWAPRTLTSATVAFTGGSATFGQDFNFTSVTVNFPVGFAINTKQKIGVLIIDDTAPEVSENIDLKILGPSNNATAVTPFVHTLVIQYNDGVGNGINTNAGQSTVKVYPNPSSSRLNIQTDEPLIRASLMRMDGKVIASTNTNSLNVSTLAKGFYMLQVETEAGVINTKVVVK